tara:strand:+ start:360 stop:644 length:285 start_codon:yes stop_codon:yes gene_type:complete
MEIDKININEIKFDEIAVISQLKNPIKPVIVNTEYVVVIKGINTHLKSLYIRCKTIIINKITAKLKTKISFFIKLIVSLAIISIPPKKYSYSLL